MKILKRLYFSQQLQQSLIIKKKNLWINKNTLLLNFCNLIQIKRVQLILFLKQEIEYQDEGSQFLQQMQSRSQRIFQNLYDSIFKRFCYNHLKQLLDEKTYLVFKYNQIQRRIVEECLKRVCRKGTFVLFRISYIDNSNPIFKEIADPVKQYSGIEDIEREEIMKNGGSISYHYGVGRLRKQFVQKYIGDTGNRVIKECQVTN